jgi:hypothetical protein
MERPQVANTYDCQSEMYQLVCSDSDNRKDRKRLDDLSRNVLVIVADYLTFI